MPYESSFQAVYRVERDGSRVWVLQLENGQSVIITETSISLYPTKPTEADLDNPIGFISRKVQEDDTEEQNEDQSDAGPGRLL